MAIVLIVDDSSTVRHEVSVFLRSQGIETDTAIDGMDGLSKIEKDPQLKLIITDVNMPVMDGLTMAEKIKASGRKLSVIMLATESSASLKQRGREAGVKGWIVKPFKGPSAIVGIRKFIE